jgi:hypothetical protein
MSVFRLRAILAPGSRPSPPEASIPVPAKLMSLAVAATVVLSAGAGQPQARRTWTPEHVIQPQPFSNHSQFGTVVVVRGQAWFFGGSNVAGPGTPVIVYRTNGHWKQPTLPSGLRSWIIAASATSPRDIWAVTFLSGSVLHWNGTAWLTVTRGGWASGTQFTGIVALSAANVWLFGASGRHRTGAGTWHWSGTAWSRVKGAAVGLAEASAASRTDLWAVGPQLLAHFNGTSWHLVRPAALAGFRYRRVLALSPSDVWVAGSQSGTPALGHFNGHVWTTVKVPGTAAATGMCRDGAGGLWVITNSVKTPTGVLHRSAAGAWTFARVGLNTKDQVLACALVPGTTAAWGAGKAAPPPGATGTAAAVYGTGPVP